MTSYQPFLISEFKTGLYDYLQPWIRPADAFEPLINAYVYRGAVSKRAGYTQFGSDIPDGNPVMGIMKWTNGTTGAAQLVVATTENFYYYDSGTDTFTIATYDASFTGFTGNISNFVNWTNWQPYSGAASLLYMANNKDPITTYNGTTVAQTAIYVDSTQTITTALDVKVYKQRLLAIRPTLSSDGAQNQSIYWCSVQNPSAWRVDIAGEGGFLDAPTSDVIESAEFIRDSLVVNFSNSTWLFRYTGSDINPFRWDKLNDSKSTNAPYASISYDERATSIGKTGLTACDGVNVQRYDIPIISYYENEFSMEYYQQTFAQRYDNLSQTWILYVSQDNKFPIVKSVAPGADKALIYNFVENTWATYTFPIPLTCLGTYKLISGETWSSLTQAWEDTDIPWQSYDQKESIILLAGDTTGHIYHMDDTTAVTDNGTTIIPDIVTTRWNPIMQMGQKTQFGYIDIYYYVASINPENPVSVTLNFYANNSNNVTLSKQMTLDGQSEYTTKIIATGNGTGSYSGSLSTRVEPKTFYCDVTSSAGEESFTDTGAGILVGSLGDTGTINYDTGAWTITFATATVATGEEFYAEYNFYANDAYAFKRIYLNVIGQFIKMEIDPNKNSFMQFAGFILWAKPAGRLTQ